MSDLVDAEHLKDLRRELAALRKDKARKDWLVRAACPEGHAGIILYWSPSLSAYVVRTRVHRFELGRGNTMDEAIDAAIEAEDD